MVIIWGANWWGLALRGLAAILLGIIAFMLPGPTLTALVILFGVYALADGVFALVTAVRGVRRRERWGAMLAHALVSLTAGVIALVWPAIGTLSPVYLVAAWALLTGIFQIAMAVRLRRVILGEWLLILTGVLSLMLAVLLLLFPSAGATAIVWWLGAYALVHGAIVLAVAFRIRSWMRPGLGV
ncbi:MAG: HdeD family acid-resistance protein [Gemmatimonadota bacterium]